MTKHLLFCFALLLVTVKAGAQDSFTVRAQRYIEQYSEMAVAEQRRSGIPASVTLAQGVLETEAGKSELVCMANNHFGIKCKDDYKGPRFLHDDDAPKECFIKYSCAAESYKDHSDYLKRNRRYSPLFNLSKTDYASWAMGLKRCGYATNPQYAQRLIKIIEDFKLQEFTYSALDSSSTKIYTMAFKPEEHKSQPEKEPLEIAVNPEKVNTLVFSAPPPPARPVPGEDTLKRIIPKSDTVQPAKASSFSEIKNMVDSVHHIIVNNDAPETPKAAPAVVVKKDTVKPVAVVAKVDSPKSIAQPVVKVDSPKTIAPQVAKTDTPKAMVQLAARVDTVKAPEVVKSEPAKPVAVAETVVKPAAPHQDTVKPQEQIIAKVEIAKPAPPPVVKPDTIKIQVPTAAPVATADNKYDSGKIITVNGLKAFYAFKGDLLLQYAVKYNIKYSHLLEINDLSDAPLPFNMLVYLERKLNSGTHVKHTVKENENIFLIAQEEGMVLKKLMTLNMLEPGDEPASGATLELQNGASHKPALRPTPAPDLKSTTNLSYVKPTPPDQFIKVNHTKPVDSTPAKPVIQDVARDKFVTTIHVPADSNAAKVDPVQSTVTAPVKKADSAVAVVPAKAAPADSVKDELESLKAQLDKVVYTDDTRLIPPPQQATKSEPIKISNDLVGPVKPVKPKKPVNAGGGKPAKGGKFYTVKKGDNFSTIAKRNGVTVKQIQDLNDVEPDELRPGQSIRVK